MGGMKELRGPQTISDDKRALSPSERGPWHCSALERKGAVIVPCPEEAVAFEETSGVKVGWCARHRKVAA